MTSDRIWLVLDRHTDPKSGGIMYAGSEKQMIAWIKRIDKKHPDLGFSKRWAIASRRIDQEEFEACEYYDSIQSYEKSLGIKILS